MSSVPKLYLKYDANSCYMDSLLIFIAMYRHTPLFSRFFNIKEADLSKEVRDLKIFKNIYDISRNLYGIARNIYNPLQEGQDDIITCNYNRNNIRIDLQDITDKHYNTGKFPINSGISQKELKSYWLNSQQDTLELWSMLKLLFNLEFEIKTVPTEGYTYEECEDDKYSVCPKKTQTFARTVDLLTNDQRKSYINDTVNFNIELRPTPGTPMYIHKNEVDNVTKTDTDYFSTFITEPGYFSVTEDYNPDDANSYPNMSVINFSDWMVIDTSSTELSGDYKNTVICKFAVKQDLPGYVINVRRVAQLIQYGGTGSSDESEEESGSDYYNTSSEGEDEPIHQFNKIAVEIQEKITNPYTDTTYIFIGGVVHSGFEDDTESSGHYTAYIKNPGTGIYMHYDDIESSYTEVGEFTKLIADTDIQTHCIMLFYIPEKDYKHNQQYSKGGKTKNSITKSRVQRKQNTKTRKARGKERREKLKQTTPIPRAPNSESQISHAPVTEPDEPVPVTGPVPVTEPVKPTPALKREPPYGSFIPGKINFIQLD